jgi:hypothetical protein
MEKDREEDPSEKERKKAGHSGHDYAPFSKDA